jgi:hypothetical protein
MAEPVSIRFAQEDELVEVDLQGFGRGGAVSAVQPGVEVGERAMGAPQDHPAAESPLQAADFCSNFFE